MCFSLLSKLPSCPNKNHPISQVSWKLLPKSRYFWDVFLKDWSPLVSRLATLTAKAAKRSLGVSDHIPGPCFMKSVVQNLDKIQTCRWSVLIGERNLTTDDFLPFTELPEDFLCKAKGLTGSEQSKSISSYLFLQILEHVESSNNRIALVNRLNFWSLSGLSLILQMPASDMLGISFLYKWWEMSLFRWSTCSLRMMMLPSWKLMRTSNRNWGHFSQKSLIASSYFLEDSSQRQI